MGDVGEMMGRCWEDAGDVIEGDINGVKKKFAMERVNSGGMKVNFGGLKGEEREGLQKS